MSMRGILLGATRGQTGILVEAARTGGKGVKLPAPDEDAPAEASADSGILLEATKRMRGIDLAKARRGGGIRAEVRQEVLEESGHKCAIPTCPFRDRLVLHHINGDPTDDRAENLLPLCPGHHELARERRPGFGRAVCEGLKDELRSTPPLEGKAKG